MSQRLKQLLLIFGDLAILAGSLWITVFLRNTISYAQHFLAFTPLLPLFIIVFYIEGIYSLRTFNKNGFKISLLRSFFLNTLIGFIYFYLFSFNDLTPKTNTLIFLFITIIGLYFFRKIFFAFFSSQGLSLKVCAIGKSSHIDEIDKVLKDKRFLGFKITHKTQIVPETIEADLIVIDRSYFTDQTAMESLLQKLDKKITIMEMSRFSELVTGRIHPDSIDSAWFIQNINPHNERLYNFTKNIMDKSVALLIFLAIVPIYAILIPLLLIISGRPIFYSQIRTGLRNQPFRIYKLRTMSTNAEKNGAQWSKPGDARITPIGKFLRMTRLDELPQLWNILNGDMSIVGPRPERPEIIKDQLEPNIPFYRLRHLVKPGVTGWAQVNYRYGYSQDDSLVKLTYDLYYVKNKSIWLDLKIILKTIKTVLTGMGQ